MDELHGRRQLQMVRAAIAAEPGRGQREQRAQALAAGADQMRRHLGDARRVPAGHALADQPGDPVHVLGDQGEEAFDRRLDGRGRVHLS